MKIDKEFIKNWKLSFTFLYPVMVACMLVRGLFMFLDGDAENMTFATVTSAFSILTLGTLILTFLIAYFGMQRINGVRTL
ncbi:hypothetical protein RT723_08600 [Psychrosphaera aquimarina]|uniref:Uncharacterized protein n=1 Tax=Psychrosphaera aquimarina TaxID=2044854 RepID=A0ABU3R0I4_9GAMM|nr:hypothetical protein [Psychrosphaera aquimarina]MDU0113054.1 hypothetical protein [Psychrosphaera aquimarina]